MRHLLLVVHVGVSSALVFACHAQPPMALPQRRSAAITCAFGDPVVYDSSGNMIYDASTDPAVQELQRSFDLIRLEEIVLFVAFCIAAYVTSRPTVVVEEWYDDDEDDYNGQRRRW